MLIYYCDSCAERLGIETKNRLQEQHKCRYCDVMLMCYVADVYARPGPDLSISSQPMQKEATLWEKIILGVAVGVSCVVPVMIAFYVGRALPIEPVWWQHLLAVTILVLCAFTVLVLIMFWHDPLMHRDDA